MASESGALVLSSGETPKDIEVTIEYEGWQSNVKDRLDAGDCLGDVWVNINSIKTADDQEAKPDNGGMCSFFVERFPIGVCTLLLVPCLPIGFACGFYLHPGQESWKKYLPPILFAIPFSFAGFAFNAFERAQWVWTLVVWAVWALLLYTPLQIIIFYTVIEPMPDEEEAQVAFLVNIVLFVFTMPMIPTILKVYNFQSSKWRECLKLFCIMIQMVGVAGCVIIFLFADYVIINGHKYKFTHPYFVIRPWTVFFVKKFAYMGIMNALSRHPSAVFRMTWLIGCHLTLNTLTVNAASKCTSWQGLLYFMGVDTLIKCLGLYCFTLAGTETLKNNCFLRTIHTILTKGKPVPFPGMVKGVYRALETMIQSITMNALCIGALLSYATVGYWIKDIELFSPAYTFWFPHNLWTLLFVVLVLLRELAFEIFFEWLATWKTKVQYKPIFRGWLRSDSMVGMHSFFAAGLFVSFVPCFLTHSIYAMQTAVGKGVEIAAKS